MENVLFSPPYNFNFLDRFLDHIFDKLIYSPLLHKLKYKLQDLKVKQVIRANMSFGLDFGFNFICINHILFTPSLYSINNESRIAHF